ERGQLLRGLRDLGAELREHRLVLADLVGQGGEGVGIGRRRDRAGRARGGRGGGGGGGGRRGRGRRGGGRRRLLGESGGGREEESSDQRTRDECAAQLHARVSAGGAGLLSPRESSSRGESA